MAFVVSCDWAMYEWWISSCSVCSEKTNCESGSGSLSSGGERPPWSWRGQRGVTAAPWLGLLRVFKCVDDPASLPIVGEDRRVLDTQVLLNVVALWMEHDRYQQENLCERACKVDYVKEWQLQWKIHFEHLSDVRFSIFFSITLVAF